MVASSTGDASCSPNTGREGAQTVMTALLPGGYTDEAGGLHREVELAPLSGREEELIASSMRQGYAAVLTMILSRCMRRLGSISPVPPPLVRRLLVADRQYLLLKLRAMTFGDRVQATVGCPWTDCGRKIDIDFSLTDVPVKESEDRGPVYEMELSPEAAREDHDGPAHRVILFRLPNGEDQEVITPLAAAADADSEAALRFLLKRCIQQGGPGSLSLLALEEIERRMDAVAPKVELTIEGECRDCGRDFAVPFDLQEFFFHELHTSQALLPLEVHYLAYHYHWSEREIMAMPRDKRRRYIEVLSDELEKLSHVG
jgi:hypothetical protein